LLLKPGTETLDGGAGGHDLRAGSLDFDRAETLLSGLINADFQTLVSFLMMEPKAMASIDFCPLAKWVGEWRKHGLVAGRGITRPARSAAKEGWGYPRDHQAKRGTRADGLALAPGAGTGPGASQTTRRHSRLRLRWSQGDDSP
jgi:hypothetical protein